MTFGHTGEAHWAELNTASALGSLTAPAPKVKVKVKVRYSINFEKFFEFDDGNRRGHSKKLFKRRSSLSLVTELLITGTV